MEEEEEEVIADLNAPDCAASSDDEEEYNLTAKDNSTRNAKKSKSFVLTSSGRKAVSKRHLPEVNDDHLDSDLSLDFEDMENRVSD